MKSIRRLSSPQLNQSPQVEYAVVKSLEVDLKLDPVRYIHGVDWSYNHTVTAAVAQFLARP